MALKDQERPKHETVMDITADQIARVYAQAFMGAAVNSPKTGELVDELESLVNDVLVKFPRLEERLRSEFVSDHEKRGILDRVLGGRTSAEVLNFLKVLSIRGRLGLLRPISRTLKKIYEQRRGMTEIEVRVARELDDVLRQEIRDQLRKTFSTEPVLRVTVDPSLIAGVVIKIGDRVYDGSVQTQLNLARNAMIERAVEMVETGPEKFLQA
jgi:F-type H+-transporting ATPase subunit delta